MTAQTTLSQTPPRKIGSEQPAATPTALQKTAVSSQAKAYWGDRWTIRFWLFCFASLAARNLIEAVHRLVLYLFGNASSP